MALESATYINNLNPLNPDGNTDYVSTVDDHVRLVKQTLQNTFPKLTGPIQASETDISSTVYIADTGTANSIVITMSPAWTSYTVGAGFTFKVAATNTSTVTINVNSLGAKALVNTNGSSLTAGALKIGALVNVKYDGTSFQLLSHGSSVFTSNDVNITPASGADITLTNASSGSIFLKTNASNAVQVQSTGVSISGTLSTTGAVTIGGNLTITGNATMNGQALPFPSGTRLTFVQASAPTGWTQDITLNDYMLRVVSTVGGTTGSGGTGGNGYGGSDSPILNNKVTSHIHTFTGSALPAHDHTIVDPGHTHYGAMGGHAAGSAFGGGGVDHTTVYTGSSTTGININTASAGTPSGTISAPTGAAGGTSNWTPKYLNMIVCTKD